jgi:hypothetical protein
MKSILAPNLASLQPKVTGAGTLIVRRANRDVLETVHRTELHGGSGCGGIEIEPTSFPNPTAHYVLRIRVVQSVIN